MTIPATLGEEWLRLISPTDARPAERVMTATQTATRRIVFEMTDRHDFDAFFTDTYGPVVASLTVAFGDGEAAAEAVQDAFIKAYSRWNRIRRYDIPQAWIRRVAINRLRDLARKRERQRRAEARAGAEPLSHVSLGAEDGGFTDLVGRLPERQRTAIVLHYLEDLPVREIAESMGISEGAVKAHLSQARANLREHLGGDDREESWR